MNKAAEWTTDNPQMNSADVLAYAEYLIRQVREGADISRFTFCDDLDSFFRNHRLEEMIDGESRAWWISYRKPAYAILTRGTYQTYSCLDGYYETEEEIVIAEDCIFWVDGDEVIINGRERYLIVPETLSEAQIKHLKLPRFSNANFTVVGRKE